VIAHIGALPLEEVLPVLSGAGTGLLAARAWIMLRFRRRRDRLVSIDDEGQHGQYVGSYSSCAEGLGDAVAGPLDGNAVRLRGSSVSPKPHNRRLQRVFEQARALGPLRQSVAGQEESVLEDPPPDRRLTAPPCHASARPGASL
jgi:hypothetical protein